MKLVILLAALASFDTKAYCADIGAIAGGSYTIEKSCRDQESGALAELEAMALEPRIETYCTEIGQVAGGSYNIMLACVRREMEAKAGLE